MKHFFATESRRFSLGLPILLELCALGTATGGGDGDGGDEGGTPSLEGNWASGYVVYTFTGSNWEWADSGKYKYEKGIFTCDETAKIITFTQTHYWDADSNIWVSSEYTSGQLCIISGDRLLLGYYAYTKQDW